MKEKLSIKPKIMELNNTNDIYMTLNICILSNDINYNKAQFLDDFIDGVIDNKETYIGIPFVVNREKLESADYENLSHELKDGELLTDQIGSFVDFWKEEIDDANCLMGSIRVMKRFPNTCKAIVELYENDELNTSCEVIVQSYAEVTEDGVRKIGYSEGKNALIASAIVTNPAEAKAKATLLVAEAYQKDIEDKEVKTMTTEKVEVFNKGNEIKFHIDINELSHDDIRQQIYNYINPVNPESDERSYKYWIREVFQTHFIIEEWDNDKLYKVEYSISGNSVTVSSDKQEVEITYQSIGTNLASEISELQSQLNKTKEELETMSQEKTVEVQELEAKIVELESKITELNELMVSEKEAKATLEGQITELNSEIETLKPFKEQVETAEKQKQVDELSAKYSRILSEDTFKSERVQEAIQSLNAIELNSVVVEEIAKEKTAVETASVKDDTVTIVASKQEDLIPKNILQKYGIEA